MKRSHQLRALAIVELYGPKASPTGGRLIPVAILVGDKWYDAGTYSATPRPLALDYGTVYEALRDGTPEGFFTIGAARQQKGEWYGVGKWESRAQLEAAEKARSAAERERTRTLSDDDGPPRLRKPGSSDTAKPAPEAPVSSEPGGKPSSPRAEAERVHPVQPEQPITPHDLDPDRPTLRRGGSSSAKQTLELPAESAPAASAGGASAPAREVLIGVSDPDGTGNTRDYRFPWKPEEEKALKARAITLAEAELNKYLAARAPAAKAKAKGPKSKAGGGRATRFTKVEVAAYDLNLDNNAELVVTGVSGDVYVTYIARTDLSFVPQKVFANVTDKDHLDAIPRMELVGPIDAEGRGRAELLFRLVSDAGYRYALYTVFREEAFPIWKSSLYSAE